jgi:hypothetical protein
MTGHICDLTTFALTLEHFLEKKNRASGHPRAALSNAAPASALAPAIYFSGALRKHIIEPIININSNFKTKNILECLSIVKYFHKISLKHGTVLDIP